MILYKYTSIESARRIISVGQMEFRRPGFFNDPFDRPRMPLGAEADPISGVFEKVRTDMKNHLWEERTAILSLTRSSTNALMWAHYADGHHGAVLEIDTELAGFMDVRRNMIPAQFGTVIYSRVRANAALVSNFTEGVVVGATHHFVLSHYEKWQRLFLTKPLEWAYEEEVRVAKCLGGLEPEGNSANESGNCSVVEVGHKPLHCFEFPKHAITRLLVGARVDGTVVGSLSEEYRELPMLWAVLDDARFEIRFQEVP